MFHLIPLPFSMILITLYTIARSRYMMDKVKYLQPVMSFLVIIIAVLSFTTGNVHPGYSAWIIAAVSVAFIADIFHIDMRKDNVLLIGLIGFSIAYMLYPLAFTRYNGFHRQDLITAVPILIFFVFVMKRLWKGLGSLRIPIAVYSLICPFMVHRAVSTFFGDFFTTTQSIMLTLGTLLLYLGDVEYGFHRFVRERKFLFGHLCYGFGQILIALSCSYF